MGDAVPGGEFAFKLGNFRAFAERAGPDYFRQRLDILIAEEVTLSEGQCADGLAAFDC